MARPKFRYVVVTHGNRMYYNLPRALFEVSALEVFTTDFYTPDIVDRNRQVLGRHIASLLARRHDAVLPSALVSSHHLPRQAWRRLRRRSEHVPYSGIDWQFGQLAAAQAARRHSASLVYGWHWPGFLAAAVSQSIDRPRLVFQDHPIPSQVLSVAGSATREGWYRGNEPEELMSSAEVKRCDDAIRKADGVLVPSEFVGQGLIDIGVPASRIAVVPLGGDRLDTRGAGSRDSNLRPAPGPLRILWVGQPIARKGFDQFLRVAARLPSDHVELSLVFPSLHEYVGLPEGLSARVYRHIPESQLQSLYLSNDVFVLPSLYEGFGMVYAEALCMGLPVVCTTNTGVAGLITPGVDGWVVAPGDEAALTGVLESAVNDSSGTRAMRLAAGALGARLSWSRFRAETVSAICLLEQRWQLDGSGTIQ